MHDHGYSHAITNERKLALAAMLIGGFMCVEVFGGIISGSLALIADAVHMLTDFASLLLAWFAMRLSRLPADWKRTYGFDRFSVLAAFVNGLLLFLISAWVCYEAYDRLTEPREVLGGIMLWIAAVGLLVNIIAFWILTKDTNNNLNIRAAALHVAGDLLGSVAALVAAIVIINTGWTPIDPILSVIMALIILKSAWSVVKESGYILLEATPHGLDCRELSETIEANIDGVLSIEHVHVWSITQERPMVTLEAKVAKETNAEVAKNGIKKILIDRFGMTHSTVEIIQV